MDYAKILKRAAEITWRHKALWLFGFLLAFVSGGGGSSQGIQYVTSTADHIEPVLILGFVFIALIIVLALIVVSAIITYLSRGALIGMVREAEETGATSIHSGWHIGWSRFLPLLAIDLVIGIPVAIGALILIILGLSPLVLLLAQRRILTILAIMLTVGFMLLVVGLLIIVGVVLSVISELAYRQCVLEKKGILDSIRDGYYLAREKLRHVGMIWLLLLGINLAVGVVVALMLLAIAAVATAPAAVIYAITKSHLPALVVGILIGIPVFLLLTFLVGVYQVFRSATWTLAYLEFQA